MASRNVYRNEFRNIHSDLYANNKNGEIRVITNEFITEKQYKVNKLRINNNKDKIR